MASIKGFVINNNKLSTEVEDTGWINLSSKQFSWTYLKYRKVGRMVEVQGRTQSLTYSGSTLYIAVIPSEYRPSHEVYGYGFAPGRRISRCGVTSEGDVFIDWIVNISDGKDYETTNWYQFSVTYFLD